MVNRKVTPTIYDLHQLLAPWSHSFEQLEYYTYSALAWATPKEVPILGAETRVLDDMSSIGRSGHYATKIRQPETPTLSKP